MNIKDEPRKFIILEPQATLMIFLVATYEGRAPWTRGPRTSNISPFRNPFQNQTIIRAPTLPVFTKTLGQIGHSPWNNVSSRFPELSGRIICKDTEPLKGNTEGPSRCGCRVWFYQLDRFFHPKASIKCWRRENKLATRCRIEYLWLSLNWSRSWRYGKPACHICNAMVQLLYLAVCQNVLGSTS